jgi:NADPH-dependent 7-cyano-7-deazaguanine reductase QueF-like protein
MNSMGINSDNSPNLFKSLNFEDLNLDNNPFGEIGFIMLFKSISKNTNLRRISLKQTQIPFIGIKHMFECLKHLNKIEQVNIEKNEIDEQSCLLIKDFIKEKNIKIYLTKSLIIPQDKINQIFDNELKNIILVE